MTPTLEEGIKQIKEEFPDEDTALERIMYYVFGGTTFGCPKCNRSSKFHRLKKLPAYSCQNCGHHVHPKAHTYFRRSRTPIQYWLQAEELLWHYGGNITAKDIKDLLGVSYKTARHMRSVILEHHNSTKDNSN